MRLVMGRGVGNRSRVGALLVPPTSPSRPAARTEAAPTGTTEARPAPTPIPTKCARPEGRGAEASVLGALAGRMRPLAATACLAGALLGGTPALGQSLEAPLPTPPAVTQTLDAQTPAPPQTRLNESPVIEVIRGDRQRYDVLVERLDRLRAKGRVTANEASQARRTLWEVFIEGKSLPLPRTVDGRVDVHALATGQMGPSNGARVLEDLFESLERRMRIDARDLARGYTPVPDAPGFKEVPPEDVRDLLFDALERMPIGDMAGAHHIEELVHRLPGTDGIDVKRSSIKELLSMLGDTQEAALRAEIEPIIEGREVEAGLLAFAVLTGVRMGSEDAAKLMDRLNPRVSLYRDRFEIGRSTLETRVRASYDDAEVWPGLDLDASLRRPMAEHLIARADLDGRLSTETGRWTLNSTLGLGYQNDLSFAEARLEARAAKDAEPTYALGVRAGWTSPSENLTVGAHGYWRLDDAARAPEDSHGRWGVELEASKHFRVGDNFGEWGAYVGHHVDPAHPERDGTSAGFVLRLSF